MAKYCLSPTVLTCYTILLRVYFALIFCLLFYQEKVGRRRQNDYEEERKKTKEKIMRGYTMEREFTAIIKQDDKWWIGWIEEVPGVNCQEDTRERLLQSLKDTLKEALEFNKIDAISAAGSSYAEERIAI